MTTKILIRESQAVPTPKAFIYMLTAIWRRKTRDDNYLYKIQNSTAPTNIPLSHKYRDKTKYNTVHLPNTYQDRQ